LLLSQRYLTAEGDILLTSQRHRTQRRNMEDCLEKLHQLIRAAWIRPKTRKPTKPTAGSRERRLQAKKHASQRRANRRIHRGE
ncbi:MAG TPA: aminoacyl-tRNA hydrolase, partial [Gemmatales bacterium]|nr:aminoacyl-tRNA hydrolase [Gemmatales bacterium]